MPDYIDLPIVVDPDDLAQQAYDYLQAAIPGYSPAPGNLESWLIEAISQLAAVVGTLASSVPTSIFRWFGANLVNLPPIDAAAATTTTTWTMKDAAGYTIPDGTQVAIPAGGDNLIPFETIGDTIIPPGDTATATGAVTIVAIDPGADGSGLGTTGSAVQLLETLDFVTAITQTATTTGGVDAEDDQTYLDRLRTELQLLTPRPILPGEFAALALNVAGVARAIAIDGYNPGDLSSGNPRMVAVVAIDEAGAAVGSGINTALVAYLEALREVNFIVNTDTPTYTEIDVDYTIHAQDGYDPAAVEANCTQAVTDFLNPANWGLPSSGDQPAWLPEPTVRYLDIGRVILNTLGVDHLTALTIGVHGSGLATTDIALSGAAPLTTAGTITGATV